MKSPVLDFIARWENKGYEKGETQQFWIELLRCILGVADAEQWFTFEQHVPSVGFIDARIPRTRVLIEQKGADKDLRKPAPQSDGTLLTPFLQAKRYADWLPNSERHRYIVVCNFREFLIYNMETPQAEPESVLLKDLAKEHYRLAFLVKEEADHLSRELEVSMRAGEIIGQIHDALLEQYQLGASPSLSASGTQGAGSAGGLARTDAAHANARALNILCTRLVFCLYAEDADIFKKDQLHAYLRARETQYWRRALLDLFQVLNTPADQRSPYLDDDLAAFPYVNGGLFKEEIEIPQFTPALRQLILQNASLDFDWSEISPTIFGAVFESTLNPATRRSGGMHYTSIENIHKVIDPLFLDSLKAEFNTIKAEPAAKKRERLLADFQDKLAGLTFLDPACGSGNFLTETYLSLRRLENEVIKARTQGQSFLGFEETNPVKVSIRQFRGIEVNDFAVTVATTALWISEAQTLAETEAIVRRDIDFLPLKSHAGIAEGNALALEWPAADYIIGNPPFIGRRYRTPAQIAEVARFFKFKDVDYVACWFKKAAQHIQGTHTRCAFVATNSITQGEQVSAIWSGLVKDYGVQIDFAHRTFRWDSEASQKAHVHCVIIGFSSSAVSSASGTQGVGSAGGLARTNAAPAQCARTNADAAQCARIGEVTLSDSAGEAARAPSTQRTGRGRDSGWDAVWHSRGYLPHCEWQQLQSVTFRLYDSVPSDTIAQWKASLQHTSEDKEEASMNSKLRKLIVQYEDAGMGQCFLRDAAVADMVQQAILRRDGTLYRLIRWCIMPNHVHMLIEPLAGVSLSDIMRSLRSYTAHEANRILNRRGKFWMNEYFDRFIRNAAHFANVVDYIDHNPVRAGLCHSPERWPWSSAGSSHRLSAVSSAVLSASEAQGVGSAGGLARTNADAAQCARTDTMPNFNEEKVTSSASAGEAARAPSTQRTGRGRSSGRIFLPDGTTVQAAHINAYLMDAPDVFIANRTKPLCDVPTMRNGNVPLDGDALKVEDADLRDFAECPHLLRRLIGGKELLNGHPRHVLWLVGVSPAEIRRYPKVYRRVEQCRANRLAMKDNATRRLAATPATFRDTLLPARYIALPLVSSERREYVPMAWFDSGTVPTNQVQIIPSATLSHFSVLTSSVHMAWMRAVCGRLKSDYRYSASVVYNNFPWPDGMASASEAQQAGSAGGLARIGEDTAALERCAQNILDARALYPDSSLADLYDPLTMPAELRKAHRDNDKAVLRLYGLPDEASEEEIVAHLFRRYAELTAESPEA